MRFIPTLACEFGGRKCAARGAERSRDDNGALQRHQHAGVRHPDYKFRARSPGHQREPTHAPTVMVDSQRRPRHRRGVTSVPGLFFLGLPWQWTRGSALIGWVKEDAAFIAERIADVPSAKTQAMPERGAVKEA